MQKTANILGIIFEDITKEGLFTSISTALEEKKQTVIFTPNPEFALAARKDSELCSVVNGADILLPDGVGIMIASRILSVPLSERITGIDAGEFILEYANKNALKIFLLGGRENASLKAAEKLSARFPDLVICGRRNGYFDKNGEENKAVLDTIKAASPDIVFVCFGFPEQEKWIHRNKDALPSVSLFAGLGGSIDVWAGDLRRAPLIFQKMGLEWLWRVAVQPSRAKIFVNIPRFLFYVLKQKMERKPSPKHSFH